MTIGEQLRKRELLGKRVRLRETERTALHDAPSPLRKCPRLRERERQRLWHLCRLHRRSSPKRRSVSKEREGITVGPLSTLPQNSKRKPRWERSAKINAIKCSAGCHFQCESASQIVYIGIGETKPLATFKKHYCHLSGERGEIPILRRFEW